MNTQLGNSDIISIAMGALLFLSEMLPFIPHIGNGLLHTLLLLPNINKSGNNAKVSDSFEHQETLEELEKKLEDINKQIEECKKHISDNEIV